MTYGRIAEQEQLLLAYVDDMLPPKERLEVEEWLASDAEASGRVAAYRWQTAELHATYDAYLNAEFPRRIRNLEQQLAEELARRPPRSTWTTATLGLLLTAAVGAGLLGANQMSAPESGENLFALLAEGTEIFTHDAAAGQAATPVLQADREPSASKAGRIAPDLGAFGFRLMASRVIRAAGGVDTVQLTYESQENGRLLLYLSPRIDGVRYEDKISLNQEGAVSVLLWSDPERTYSMIGERLGREAMLALGKAVNNSLADQPLDAGDAQPPAAPDAVDPERPTVRHSDQLRSSLPNDAA